MAKVYVVQKQLTTDRAGNLVPKHDLSSAQKYGELVFLLSPTAGPFNSEGIIKELQEKLADYQPGEDFLLLVGNPCLIGWAVAIASRHGPGLNLLQWSSRNNEYAAIRSYLP